MVTPQIWRKSAETMRTRLQKLVVLISSLEVRLIALTDGGDSNVVVSSKLLRLFFAGAIGDIQCLQVSYASECKVLNERGKGDVWKGCVSRY